MPTLRLLTSVHGDNSPVVGDLGDELEVTDAVAAVWADGERAELVEPEARTVVGGAPRPPRRPRRGSRA